MPSHTDNLTRDRLVETRELTERELDAISGGKPAKSPPPQPEKYLTMVMTDVLISGY